MIFERSKNRIFKGATGDVIINENADRVLSYWLWQITPSEETFHHFAEIRMLSLEGTDCGISILDGSDDCKHNKICGKSFLSATGNCKVVKKPQVFIANTPYWGTVTGNAPLDSPLCGFYNEMCPQNTAGRDSAIISGFSVLAIAVIIVTISIYYVKRERMQGNVLRMSWRILYEDLRFPSKSELGSTMRISLSSGAGAMANCARNANLSTFSSATGGSTYSSQATKRNYKTKVEQMFAKIVYYKGAMYAVKKITKSTCSLTREDLMELKQMKEIVHENLCQFVGACVDPPNICIVNYYCGKGSLQDLLEHEEIGLEWIFKYSLACDLANGMYFLHSTPLGSHGNLKSSCCLIDNRWTLKITNFGLKAVKDGDQSKEEVGEYQQFKSLLWTAPELLRMDPMLLPRYGTQEGDVYSFGIIVQEILFRSLPFFLESGSTPKEVIENVKLCSENPFRPPIPHSLEEDRELKVVKMMKECWAEVPSERPNFKQIVKTILKMNKGKKIRLFDNMIKMLEKYSNNLEDIMEKRTGEMVVEKKKTDMLLYRLLPQAVAERLKMGHNVPPELFEEVTIYFSDIVGFTALAADSTPVEVVDMLNDLYSIFDEIISKHNVYKVETQGDAYMVVAGLPMRIHQHAQEIGSMALQLRDEVKHFKIKHRPDRALMVRIGVHSGPCAAGVVGIAMPRYCLFGETVTIASKMEASGQAMKIHMSEEAYIALAKTDKFYTSQRGKIEIPGRGFCNTYWLDGAVH